MSTSVQVSRYRVPRTRGAIGGALLVLLGAWAALAPMIGPYFDLAYTPAPDDDWYWTAARGWLEVLPGGVVIVGGVLLIASTSRVITSLGGWLAAIGGGWLIVGPPLADTAVNIDLGTPDPASSVQMQALESLLLFYGVGALIVLLAGLALGRLSVLSLRDLRAAERRIAEEQAEDEAAAYRRELLDVGRHGRHDDTDTERMPLDQPVMGPREPSYPTTGYTEPTYARTAPPPPEDGFEDR